MPQEIYNEGRVVGYSAWEIFMREALNNGVPPESIPDEHEWLASMIGSGASMILKIPANTAAGVHDYPLPLDSNLTAAGVIIASPFLGSCEFDASGWAKKVTSYSPIIQNDSTNYPTSSAVPFDSNYNNEVYKESLSEFIKITDGIVFTDNAKWIQTESGAPYEDINPNFNESTTTVRLYINTTTSYETYILLTGFNNKRILQAVSGYAVESEGHSVGGSADTDNNNWPDGGMLGPEIIPWASKIIFAVPSSTYYLLNALTRTIPSDTSYTAKTVGGIEFKNVTTTVKTNSLVDLNSINLVDYYTVHSADFSGTPTLQENVTAAALGNNESYNTIVAWYPGMTAARIKAATDSSNIFPPAVYATQVTSTGTKTLVPLDTAAPGTVKCFENSTQAYNYKQWMPDNYAIYHNPTTNMFSFVTNSSNPSEWIGTSKLEYLSGDYPKTKLTVGTMQTQMISLTNSSGTPYGNNGVLDGSGGNIATTAPRTLIWDDMLKSLKANKAINILGTKLTSFATELNTNNTIGITNTTTEIGSAKFTITGSNSVNFTAVSSGGTKMAKLGDNMSIKSGTDFVEFSNGLRIYISKTAPTGTIPEGSIGIGW